jgi:predicted transcriptional regulator
VEQESPRRVDVDWVAPIVTGYVRHNKIAPDQLAGIVGEVHRALAGIESAALAQEPPRPAVRIRRSVQQDYVVCLESGFRATALRPHLRVRHGLGVGDYRARWKLPMIIHSPRPAIRRDAR